MASMSLNTVIPSMLLQYVIILQITRTKRLSSLIMCGLEVVTSQYSDAVV